MEQRAQRSPVELKVGGQTYRVHASAEDATLHRLADVVDAKLREHGGAHVASPQALVLAAMALAHELEEERAKLASLESRSRKLLRSLLARIDSALGANGVTPGTQSAESRLAAIGRAELVEVRRVRASEPDLAHADD